MAVTGETTSRKLFNHSVLVVEDDDFFREALVGYLTSRGLTCTQAPNGKVARDICGVQTFDLILSDVQMPFLDGVEFLKWVKANNPMKFVLMTGFTHLLEVQTAYELGADDFLTKPFKNADLGAIVEKILQPNKKQDAPGAAAANDATVDFCKVSIDEFVSKPTIEFDVYVKLGESKMVKIGHAGDQIPKERIQTYKDRGLKCLYIRKEDFAKLVDFNLALSKVVTKSSVDPQKKLSFMKYTGEVILEKAFVDGVDKELFSDAKEMLVSTVNVLTEDSTQLDLVNSLNVHSDWVYAHSVATGMFAMMIARRLGYTSPAVFFKLGMAGLFHEIGYKEISREIIDKPRPLMSQAERELFETHVSRGKEILLFVKGVPGDVIDIVYQHHEDLQGQGYPRGLNNMQIHPLTKIFQVADRFADIVIKGPQFANLSGAAAVEHVDKFFGDKLDRDALNALRSIFGLPAKSKAA